MAGPSFTQQLLNSDRHGFQQATQSPFLAAAARGEVPKDILGKWLANDRMYIHNYIIGGGRLLCTHELPLTAAESSESPFVKLVDWVIEALVNVRREERFFIDTARQYGITIDLPKSRDGTISDADKIEGLRRFEDLFGNCSSHTSGTLAWLEDAVVFWGTEKCYLDAWSWSKSQIPSSDQEFGSDQDGGALRREFIPNWSSHEFAVFVDKLGAIIDEAVDSQMEQQGPEVRSELFRRASVKWKELLAAEQTFWPEL